MPWYYLAWFNIKLICDDQMLESRWEKQRNTWHLECTKTFQLEAILPSVGVPSMPLLEKVNWWLINPLMCSFPFSLTCFSLFLPWQSLARIDTPLHILACLINWHILSCLTCLCTIWHILAFHRMPWHSCPHKYTLYFFMTWEPNQVLGYYSSCENIGLLQPQQLDQLPYYN